MPAAQFGLSAEDVALLKRLKSLLNGSNSLLLNSRMPVFANAIPIKVKNTSGETIPPFSCLKPTGYQNDDGREAIEVDKPDGTLAQFYLCSGKSEILDGDELGIAYFGEPCFAKYETGSPAFGQSWGPEPDKWTWAADRPGAIVIGVKGSNKMRIIPVPITGGYAKADGTIANGSTGTISVWYGNFGGDTSIDIEGAYNASLDVASGDKLSYELINGKWGFGKLCS